MTVVIGTERKFDTKIAATSHGAASESEELRGGSEKDLPTNGSEVRLT